jgi:L-asparaginase
MSTKIALIGFGGTIAMVPNARGALAPAKSAEELVAQAPSLKEINAQLDVIQLQNKDSTNLNPEDWQLLIAKIMELYPNYDGFIITHGTDTMPHTATAVALALNKQLNKPIIFTGAQLPMAEPGTDARVNLERSMKVAVKAVAEEINEVMIVFSARILRASRTIKRSESSFDAFDSPAFPNLGIITATEIAFIPLAIKSDKKLVTQELKPQSSFSSNVMTIDVKPGLEPGLVKEVASSPLCEAIILRSLGAGHVPSEGRYSLVPVIRETVAAGKPVIIATKFVGGKTVPTIYESGQAAIDAGAGHAGDMTDVATEVKLAWLMGQGIHTPEGVKKAMLESVAGEIS